VKALKAMVVLEGDGGKGVLNSGDRLNALDREVADIRIIREMALQQQVIFA
jgi:hypothetical protein